MADDAEFVSSYCELLQDAAIKSYLDLSQKIGGLVAQQASLVQQTFNAQLTFLRHVAECSQPDQATLQKLLKPTSDSINAIVELKEKNRASKQFNHLSTVGESIGALGWVVAGVKPGPHMKEMIESGQFYGNRVIKEFRETDMNQVQWVRSWMNSLQKVHDYVVDFHRSGIMWNPKGRDPKSSSSGSGAPPPPPGPPPPISQMAELTTKVGGSDGDKSALFAALNKGADVTRGLRKVTDDMKTHKNPALRGAGVVKETDGAPSSMSKSSNQKSTTIKKPVFSLDGNKWLVENQTGNKQLKIEDTNMKQAIYIFKCVDSMVQISGKVNSITVDSCKKVALVVNDLVSCLDFVNCQSVQCQIMGKVPVISIDKTDGCQVYLSKDSTSAELVTAKSSEMNILVPSADGYTEHALPEQFKSMWNGKEFVTVATDINK